jgi:predicted acyltransferase
MRQERSDSYRMKVLAGAALACFASGLALSVLNPMVKRLWTASFTLASSGWVFLILLVFYWLAEVKGYRKLVFPLVVVGMNSIFIYCLHIVLHRWLNDAVEVFTGGYSFLGSLAPVAQATTIFLVMWYLCYWLYRRKIFLRV